MPEQQTTTTSGQWSLSLRDAIQGFIVAALGAAITTIYSALQTGGLNTINWATVGAGALAAGLGYLLKKFFQPPVIVMENPTKAEVKAVKEGDAEAKVLPK